MQTGVRKITNGRYRKIIGLFSGLKIGQIWWEGYIERDFLFLAEADPDVLRCDGQPLTIEYYIDGVRHTYTPDFRVIRRDRKQLVEIKKEADANREENLRLFEQAEKISRRNGYEFLVVTDTMIRVEPKLSNIKLLNKYARTLVNIEEQHICRKYFLDHRAITLGEAVHGLEKWGISKNQLFALLFRGYLITDMSQKISDNALLNLSEGFLCLG